MAMSVSGLSLLTRGSILLVRWGKASMRVGPTCSRRRSPRGTRRIASPPSRTSRCWPGDASRIQRSPADGSILCPVKARRREAVRLVHETPREVDERPAVVAIAKRETAHRRSLRCRGGACRPCGPAVGSRSTRLVCGHSGGDSHHDRVADDRGREGIPVWRRHLVDSRTTTTNCPSRVIRRNQSRRRSRLRDR